MKHPIHLICFVAISGASLRANEDLAAHKQFLNEHCGKCHTGKKPKGGFDLGSLSPGLSNSDSRRHWLSVLEQIETGEMPPESKPRPPATQVEALTTWIRKTAAQSANGRVVMRRLNRAEYANTVRDLLGVEIDLADLLPPDTSTNGFDNNAESLHTSSYLLRSYLDAADRLLDEAIVNESKPWQVKKRFDLKDEAAVKRPGSVYRFLEDGVAIFAVWESANIRVTMWNFRSPFRGKYRFRISAYGFQSQGKPVKFHVTAGTFKEVTEERLLDYYSVPADKPTVIEFTAQLEPENRIRIIADDLPATPPMVEKVGAEKYEGPGLVVQWVDAEGPLMDSWPPASHMALFGDLKQKNMPKEDDPDWREVVSENPLPDAERILRQFARRAFRRPVTDEDIQPLLAGVRQRLDAGHTFEQAVRVGLKAVLVSPHFLFFREKDENGRLDDHALASRLSYFLWSSMPDEELFRLATDQKLHQPEVLRQQVERLLKDPKAAAFTREFTGQWLSLRAIDATMPDRTLYPEYDDSLKTAMLKETNLFFDELLTRDLPLTNFVASDFTFLNERLAKHYGIPGVEGMEMQRVNLPAGSHRGGVMTMGSVLKVTANGTTTSPVLRGSWVLERILGTPPAKPPVDVEAIEPDIRGATTIREQLAKHRDVETCSGCHKKIDPPGFALESFDVIGGWRTHYRSLTNNGERDSQGRRVRPGPAVDPADVLTDGRRFQNIDEFKQLLLTDKDQLTRNLAEKLLAYATGAEPAPLDRPQIDVIVKRVSEQGMGFRTLIHEIVQSALFQTK
ncbi:MAG: DUF1592 domain-containing protein [Verrucomicrobia bacterium]|nr:DUF1592 domain-containing protein [Verrucomicrobiota bacterium]